MSLFYKWLALLFTGLSVCLSVGTLVAPSMFQTLGFLICAWISLSCMICVIGILKSYDDILYMSLCLIDVCALIYSVFSLYLL